MNKNMPAAEPPDGGVMLFTDELPSVVISSTQMMQSLKPLHTSVRALERPQQQNINRCEVNRTQQESQQFQQ